MKVQTDGPDAVILLSWGIKEQTKETEEERDRKFQQVALYIW